MERLVIAGALVVVCVVVAFILNRRRPQAPTQGQVAVPSQLDRADFPEADRPWLIVVWTSKTCASCEQVVAKARLLESPQVAYAEVAWQEHRDLHDRYGVADVPLLVLADAEGVVRLSFVGTPNFTDLAGAVAEARSESSD
jgi:hypothetical protein